MIVFPRKTKSPKQGEVDAKTANEARRAGYEGKVKLPNEFFPIDNKVIVQEGKVSDYPSEEGAYKKLRQARSDARLAGKREKRAKAKEDEAAAAKK